MFGTPSQGLSMHQKPFEPRRITDMECWDHVANVSGTNVTSPGAMRFPKDSYFYSRLDYVSAPYFLQPHVVSLSYGCNMNCTETWSCMSGF